MTDRLAGKVAIIVGGATGFGRACTERFAREGATAVVAGRRAELAERVAAEHGGAGGVCDVSGYVSGQVIVVDGANTTQKLPAAADYEMLAAQHPELL